MCLRSQSDDGIVVCMTMHVYDVSLMVVKLFALDICPWSLSEIGINVC